MTDRELLDLALAALEWNMDYLPSQGRGTSMARDAITAIKQARAPDKKAENARELGLDYEPVQRPVAWYEHNPDLDAWFLAYTHNPKVKSRPLVFGDVTPPAAQRPWVSLTDGRINAIYEQHHNQYADCLGGTWI
jgi:hypothetical protein